MGANLILLSPYQMHQQRCEDEREEGEGYEANKIVLRDNFSPFVTALGLAAQKEVDEIGHGARAGADNRYARARHCAGAHKEHVLELCMSGAEAMVVKSLAFSPLTADALTDY